MTTNTDDAKTGKLLTAQAIGEILSLSKRQVFRLRSSGKIPMPVRIGGSVRWRLADIDEWIAAGCPDGRSFQITREGQR